MISKKVLLLLIVFLIAPIFLSTADAGCNVSGCFLTTVHWLKVDSDGKIWFIITNGNEDLSQLITEPACTLKQQHVGGSIGTANALYISPNDPHYDAKYTILMTAYVTGELVGFSAEFDPDNGWCKLAAMNLKPEHL